MLSIITVVNKKEIFENHLHKTLSQQTSLDYELIVIDNCDGKYDSLGKAYNDAIRNSKGDWLLFIHPDIEFLEKDSLYNFWESCKKLNNQNKKNRLFGVAGTTDNGEIVSSILLGPNKSKGKWIGGNSYINVDCVDACCFALPKNVIKKGFATYLKGFHMFVEDLCVQIKKSGGCVLTISANMWHMSPGSSLDWTYYRNTRKLFQHYSDLLVLNTTSFTWRRNDFLYLKLMYYEVRNYIHHLFV